MTGILHPDHRQGFPCSFLHQIPQGLILQKALPVLFHHKGPAALLVYLRYKIMGIDPRSCHTYEDRMGLRFPGIVDHVGHLHVRIPC